jgi:hypothetical protein
MRAKKLEEKKQMPINDPNRGTYSPVLSGHIKLYDASQTKFIANQVLPPAGVKQFRGVKTVMTREDVLKMVDTEHANGAAFNRVTLSGSEIQFKCQDYGLEGVVTRQDIAEYGDRFDAELAVATKIRHAMLMAKEKRVADKLIDTSKWTGAALYTDRSGTPWATASTNVFAHIEAAKEIIRSNTGVEANTLVLNGANLSALLTNEKIVGRFPGAPIVTEAMLRSSLAALFGLANLLVGGAVYDTSAENKSFAGSYIWPSTYVSVCHIEAGDLQNPSVGRTLVNEDMCPADDVYVARYEEPQTQSSVVQVQMVEDNLIIDPSFAHLIKVG